MSLTRMDMSSYLMTFQPFFLIFVSTSDVVDSDDMVVGVEVDRRVFFVVRWCCGKF